MHTQAHSPVTDYFKVFEIDRTFGVDRDTLEALFHRMQSESHPDRHVQADAARREQALSESSGINTAYRTLRDPISRAKHLLDLYGYAAAEQKAVPQSLLMAVMEAQEKIMELESTRDPAVKQRLFHELGAVAEQLENKRTVLDSERERISHQWDTNLHPETKSELTSVEEELLGRMAQILAERAYIGTLHASVQAAQQGRPAIIKH